MCNNAAVHRTRATAQRGMSIIELMVGMVVALLVALAATNSAISFTASQRQGLGAGGVAVNSATVLAAIKDDVGVSGLGFFGDQQFLCHALNLSQGAATTFDGTAFSPLQVTRTADSDTIDMFYASRVESGANILLNSLVGNVATLNSYLPVAVNDAVLLAPKNPAVTSPCVIRTVTNTVPPTATTPQTLTFASSGKHNGAAFTVNTAFDETSRVMPIGMLRWSRYRVVAGNLVLERPLDGTSAILARNVIAFRVQFGAAGAGAGTTAIETWEHPTGTFASIGAANLPRVRALRIGLIVRSPQVERRDSSGNCNATEVQPTLFGLPPEHLTNADWGCWRYRTSTVLVPLRNIVMGLL
jgi:type IV pilus assembly protein PilW